MNQQNNNQNQNPSQQQREQQQREQQQRERQNDPNQGQGAGLKPGEGGKNIDKSAVEGQPEPLEPVEHWNARHLRRAFPFRHTGEYP